MFQNTSYWVLNMSIIASFMGLLVLILRKIKVIPKRVSVFLWIIPFFRMCVPFGINNPYSLMTLISKFTMRTVTVYEPLDPIKISTSNAVMLADSYAPMVYKKNILEGVFSVATYVWITVALALIIAFAVLYFITKREIKDAKKTADGIYLSDKVDSPAVYGIIKPKIVLPGSFSEANIKYVIRHEKTHIRRGDNFWRLLGFLAACVHWFNPLSWLFLKAFLEDLEIACDETAVKNYESDERKEYAKTLLEYAGGKNIFVSAFGGAKVRTRIENVLSYKRMTVISAIGFAILTAAVIFALITNAG